MRLSFAVAALFFVNITAGQEVNFIEYFPLQPSVLKVYKYDFRPNEHYHISGIDSSFCIMVKVKGREIFYFDDDTSSHKISTISSSCFLRGAYFFDKDYLNFSPLFWKKDVPNANLDFFDPLFPSTIQVDSVYQYRECYTKWKFRFTGFEDIMIGGDPLKGCLKLEIEENWETTQYHQTVWFKKGFGIVKWIRTTGRTEEIILLPSEPITSI